MRIETMLVHYFVFAAIFSACNAVFPDVIQLNIFSNTTRVSTFPNQNVTPVISTEDCNNPTIQTTNLKSPVIEFRKNNGWEIRVNNNLTYTDIVQEVTTTTDCITIISSSFKLVTTQNPNIISLRNNTSLDYDNNPDYNFQITAEGYSSTHLNVTVKVTDVDDLGVEFNQTVYQCSMTENKLNETCKVTAHDMDKGINALIRYSIQSVWPTWNSFSISTDGTITTSKTLDRENQSSYTLSIAGYQANRPLDRVNFTTVVINVVDVDDNPPIMKNASINVNLQENAPMDTFVIQVFATDADEGLNANFTFNFSNKSEASNFTIESSTGILRVGRSPPDRETLQKQNYIISLKVFAKSVMNESQASNETTIVIKILDVNDNSPQFHGTQIFNISKTQTLETCITKLNVTDADDGLNGNFTVSMKDTSTFNVTSDGELWLVHSLNKTCQKTYVLTVTATDLAQPPSDRTTTIDVTVNVKDVNIHTPKLTITRHFNISEDAPVGTVVADSMATDADPDDHLVCYLNTFSDTFEILNYTEVDMHLAQDCVTVNARITTKKMLNREETSNYTLTLVCNDTVHNTNKSFTINLLDVNDNEPQFENGPYNFSVDENNKSALVGKIKATDADKEDNGRLSFWIDKDCLWAKNITINNSTGEIHTIDVLDREVADQLPFTVFVSDNGQPSLMSETRVTVHVLDVDDNPPVFVTRSQKVNISENTAKQYLHNISQVKATDADTEANRDISYFFFPNTTSMDIFNATLMIDQKSGVISLSQSPKLDKMCVTNVSIQLAAYGRNTTMHDNMTLILYVIDVNDHPPLFPQDLEIVKQQEEGVPDKTFVFSSNNSEIQYQLASDDDCDKAYKTLHYWMDNTDDRFQINSSNGFISLRQNRMLDYDPPVNDRNLNFTIFVTDGVYVSSKTVSMTVINAIDSQPKFSQDVYRCEVDENFKGETECSVTINYPENNDTIANKFSLQTNNESVDFRGQSLVRQLNILKSFDFEQQQEIAVAVNVTNQLLSNIIVSNCTVIIRVLPVNDEPPEFHNSTNQYDFRFKESSQADLTIGFINVTDKDSPFTMELKCNGSAQYFDVRANGDVFTTYVFDYENETDAHSFVCIITANDTVHSENRSVTIMVENINDNYPQFGESRYTLPINETHEKGKYILQISASDKDVDDTISYNIAGGNSSGLVLNKTTGDLSSNANFSGPVKLNFVVEACDNGAPQLCNYTDVAIDVLNVNNHSPVFSKRHPVVQIYENTQVFVAQLEATDIDGDKLNYTIENGTLGFYMNGSSLYANNINAEDYRASSGTCELSIIVSDGLFTDSTLLNITILDINESPPRFVSIQNNTEIINETLSIGSHVLDIKATDEDLSNTGFVFVLYNSEGIFSINDTTGEITLAKSVQHAVGYYNITVVVHDNGHPSKSNSTKVTVIVKDVNESPSVNLYPSTVFLSSDSPNGKHVATINASDPDSVDIFKILNLTISVNSTKTEQSMFVKQNMTICTDKKPLLPGNHSLNLTVMDGGGLTAWTNMHVVVYDTKYYNEDIPVNENDKLNSSLVNASSALESRFSIEPSVDMGKFIIINNTLVMTDSFDREETENVTLILHGFDVHDILVSIITIQIKVLDINDCVPELDERYEFSINDDTENNTVVTQIIARDRDVMPQNRNVSYSLRGPGNDTFSMSADGSLRVESLQLYGFNEYHLTLEATDGLHKKTAKLNITVVDTNDHSPIFTDNCFGPFEISENVTAGTTVGKLLTSDLDVGRNGNVTFSINAGNENQTFSIETRNMTGIIKTNRSLDRETRPGYVLTIVATDHAPLNPRMAVCSVVITVLDVNDNAPTFMNPDGYKGSIAENASLTTIVEMHGALIATDPDEDWSGTDGIVYIIDENNVFLINPTNGTISLNGSLDREKHSQINLTVTAADSNGTSNCREANTTVVIDVIDVNDNAPSFNQKNYTFNVTENANSSVVVGVVNASDIDGPGNNNIRYSIVSGDFGRFYIDSLLGTLYAAGNIDREDKALFQLNVSASDGTFSNCTSVTIYVNDVNDNAPMFENVSDAQRIYISINENTTTPVNIYQVRATDHDDSNTSNSQVQYELVNNTASNITINETTGEITINGPVDREKQDAYTLYVKASDRGLPVLSSILIVEIQILDINDNAPIFYNSNGETISSVNASIIEESPVGSVIALINATDSDAGKNGLVDYSFNSSSVSNLFKINKNGIVQLKEPMIINSLYQRKIIDTNDTNNVVLMMTIIAFDYGTPNKSSQLNFFVHIEPINDNAPVFPQFLFHYVVNENSNTGTFVGQCEASIRNESISHMTYSLMENFDSFAIDNNHGNITTTRLLDRESQDMYMLTVRVTDGRIPERTAFAAVNVTIQDVNDNIPQFNQTITEITVLEETIISRNISVGAFDRDLGNNATLSYYLEENNDTRFAVENTSGMLFLNGTFDYEQQTAYNLTVVVQDNGNPRFNNSMTIVLLISDVNDNNPIFTYQSANCSLMENVTIGTKVISVNANDSDSGWNGQVVYRIIDDNNCPFSINFLTGEIQTDGPLDYERQNICTLIIMASDLGTPPLTANMTSTVNILDIYDVIPRFERPFYQVTLNSSNTNGTHLVTVNSTGSGLHYSLKDDFDRLYQIADDGMLSLAKDISEASVYRSPFVVAVSVTDQLNTSASCLVIVRIVKEQLAVVAGSVITSDVSEATAIGGLITDIDTTAEIAGENVQYSIINVEPKDATGMFNITRSDGKVYFYRGLDRETHDQYILKISVQHGDQTRTRRSILDSGSILKLVINILDEKDNTPEFVDVPQSIEIPLDMGANQAVTTVKAIDRDIKADTEITYSISGGDNDTFSINNVSGVIETRVPIAMRNSNTFRLTVLARNGPYENDSAQVNVSIQVKPTDQVVVLTVQQNVSSVTKNVESILWNMSSVLPDIEVKLQRLQQHIETLEPPLNSNKTEAARSDLFIYGVNKTSREIVSREQMVSIIQSHIKELTEQKPVSLKRYDPSAINNSQLVIIAFAIAIFFGALIAIVFALFGWSRYEEEVLKLEQFREHHDHEDYELSTLGSRQASQLSSALAAASAVNTAYAETMLSDSFSQVSPKKKKETVYETQEVTMEFRDEHLDSPPSLLGDSARSIVDSGVGTTSVELDAIPAQSAVIDRETPGALDGTVTGMDETDDGITGTFLTQEDVSHTVADVKKNGPVMTSSPRASRPLEFKDTGFAFRNGQDLENSRDEKAESKDDSIMEKKRSGSLKTRRSTKEGGKFVSFADIGETATDDEFDNDEENVGEPVSEKETEKSLRADNTNNAREEDNEQPKEDSAAQSSNINQSSHFLQGNAEALAPTTGVDVEQNSERRQHENATGIHARFNNIQSTSEDIVDDDDDADYKMTSL
ncbi:protocadherin Fat 4-like isoform X32 [Dreissena polymorpha]|uniref:protocadherin Fat 4-like isoform X32 n=1 Tax=Dreissena polymorpha TaxID=45954 RepID=UPI0022644C75|nr:protocadherin Fat 4-like isoform X32 [Dreissena polymorpha]